MSQNLELQQAEKPLLPYSYSQQKLVLFQQVTCAGLDIRR